MAVLISGSSLNPTKPTPIPFNRRPLKHKTSFNVPCRFSSENTASISLSQFFRSSTFRIRSIQQEDADNYESSKPKDNAEEQDKVAELFGDENIGGANTESSFFAKLAPALGVAAIVRVVSVGLWCLASRSWIIAWSSISG